MGDFYRKFEDRYRGSRAVIKERLRVYLPFVKPLQIHYPQSIALDIGCGRGEWLELLSEEGFKAKGIDLDGEMLAACKALGLDAEMGDAIEILNALPDESASIISAFHVVEHIDFDNLMIVIKHALRVLVPGGVLILETPNPENLVVSAQNFYLDPTHLKPIPSLLLSFVVEYCGFERVKTLRLQEAPALHGKDVDVRLMDVLDGVSPDYSIVAQKFCGENFKSVFNKAFTKEYGVTLNELAERYDMNVQMRMQHAVAHSDQQWQQITDFLRRLEHAHQQTNVQMDAVHTGIDALSQAVCERNAGIEALTQDVGERDVRIEQLSDKLAEREAKIESLMQDARTHVVEIEQLTQKITELVSQVQIGKQSTHHWWQAYDKLSLELELLKNTLSAVHESTSWRVTAPLRWLKTILVNRFWRGIKVRLKIALSKLAAYVNRHPVLRRMALRIIHRIPGVRLWLMRTIGQSHMQPTQKNVSLKARRKAETAHKHNVLTNAQHLPLHAQRVYKTLRMELTRNCEEKH